jgi:hypothetical protein
MSDVDGEPGAYRVVKGASIDDERLDVVAALLKPANAAQRGELVKTGDLVVAAEPWQTLPPGHGTTYEEYRETESQAQTDDEASEVVTRIWVDARTKLPIRELVTLGGFVEQEVHYDYDRSRKERSELAADVFAVPQPDGVQDARTMDLSAETRQEDPTDGQEQESPTQETERSTSFRRSYGLDLTKAVTLMLDDVAGFEDSLAEYGVRLTADELDELRLRDRATEALDPVFDRIRDTPELASTYAGAYVDQQAGGLMHIGFTQAAEQRLAELRSVYAYPDRLRTFTAKLTKDQLKALMMRVEGDLEVLAGQGVPATGVAYDTRANKVVVTTEVPDPAQALVLSARYGGDVILRQASPLSVRAIGYGPRTFKKTPPFLGGVAIGDQRAFPLCTSAFSVRRGTRYRKLTAGHCGDRGGSWFTAYNRSGPGRIYQRQGTMTASEVGGGGTVDVGQVFHFKGVATSRIYVYPGQSNRYRRMTRQAPFEEGTGEGADGRPQGTSLCFLGFRHKDPQCGPLLYENFTAENYGVGNGRNYGRLRRQKIVEVASLGGDSGGPFYRSNTAWGVLGAGGRAGGRNITSFTPISNVTRRFGTRIVGRPRARLPRTP